MTRMRISQTEIRDADIFEILLDNFPDMIHSIDHDDNIVYANKTAEKLLGYTVDELLTMNVRQIYADEIQEQLEKGFSDLKEKGDKTVESILKTKTGENIPVEIRSFGIYDDNGKFVRTFSILRDIRKIKDLQQSLVHAGRLAAIGEMASGVAHDINNPLTVIVLSLEMTLNQLKRSQIPPHPALESIQNFTVNAQRASQSIQRLSEHLRNFSRGMAEKHALIDVYDIVSDSLFIASNRVMKAGVTVNNQLSRRTHYIKGSSNQIEQIFVNLISNACDAMENRPERTMTIAAEPVVSEGNTYWKFSVSDTGAGIPEHIREDIFQSFFTTKPKGKGTGLGLSISNGIVADHKGYIQLASEVDKGTTFSVCLPQATGPDASKT